MPPDIRRRVLAWFEQAYFPHEESRPTENAEVLEELPAPLRAACVEAIIGSEPLRAALSGVSEDTFVWLASRLQPLPLHALHALVVVGEPAHDAFFLVRGQLAVVRRGLVVGRVVEHASCFGGGLLLQQLAAEEVAAGVGAGDGAGSGGGGAGGGGGRAGGIGGAAAAAQHAAEEEDVEHGRWPCTVQAATEADVFALHLDDMRALTRGREELLELVRSLARVDAVRDMDITGEGSFSASRSFRTSSAALAQAQPLRSAAAQHQGL